MQTSMDILFQQLEKKQISIIRSKQIPRPLKQYSAETYTIVFQFISSNQIAFSQLLCYSKTYIIQSELNIANSHSLS